MTIHADANIWTGKGTLSIIILLISIIIFYIIYTIKKDKHQPYG